MTSTVELPYWVLILVLGFAAIAALDRVLVPSVRWFFRRRMERAVARLNTRLQRPIAPFKLLERHDRILRLVYDPQVMEAVVQHAHDNRVPESVAFDVARGYAREIVPGFSATIYFGFATRAARIVSRMLYRVRVAASNEAALRAIDPKATVIFIINHRSNMDYILVTWLVSERMTLSYAVGEWARVWPLSRLVRAMGAYFIRRRYRSPLYRRVLERYVQMATAEGVAQAIFPEGGLSLDGRVGEARLGLLTHIMDCSGNAAGRDVVFIPVGLSYDRVLEDRLLTEALETGIRRFRARPTAIASFVLRMTWRALRRRFGGFGAAGVGFGAPLSLRDFMATTDDPTPRALADLLMEEVRKVVPVLPVPLVAAVLDGPPVSREDLPRRIAAMMTRLRGAGVQLKDLPTPDVLADEALAPLLARKLVIESDGMLRVAPGMEALLAFHAAPIRQHLDAAPPMLAKPDA